MYMTAAKAELFVRQEYDLGMVLMLEIGFVARKKVGRERNTLEVICLVT